jgi:hypothetical protein
MTYLKHQKINGLETSTTYRMEFIMINVSIIASAVRPVIWPEFFKSLENTSVKYEVIFAGDCCAVNIPKYKNFFYIETADIKPAQCYEIARREASGETIMWVADDCEFIGDIVGKAYRNWKDVHNFKDILSIQTREIYPARS